MSTQTTKFDFDVVLVIIGAGPAGISMAAEATKLGIQSNSIIVLEKEKEHSWSIRKFYPEQKLVTANYKGNESFCHGVLCMTDLSKKDTLSLLDKVIEDYKINVLYQHPVHSIKKEGDYFIIVAGDKTIRSRICSIAIGIFGRPNKPDYAISSELRELVAFDITSRKYENKKILVVGGGDSASEYAQYLQQIGNKVSLCYRKNSFDRMNFINRQSIEKLIEERKVDGLLGIDIVGLEMENNQVRPVFSKEVDSEKASYDHVIYALGGTTPDNFLKLVGIDFFGGRPKLTGEYETNIPGLFLIGDLASDKKGGSIISAFNSAHFAMQGAGKYLSLKENSIK